MKNKSNFELVSDFAPCGDQPKAIAELTRNILANKKYQVLLGATGTGKTFTIANVIKNVGKKTLVIVHNKTLAAQLYSEFKQFFKNNKVEYYISYFDYYQPEAYIPRTDTYIEKSSKVNQEIEMLRISSLNSLVHRNDVIVVASVAAIYAASDPKEFSKHQIEIAVGQNYPIKKFLKDLVKLNYVRAVSQSFDPGTFRCQGDVVDMVLGNTNEYRLRISFFGDEIESITQIDILTGNVIAKVKSWFICPANEYVSDDAKFAESLSRIRNELKERIEYFKNNNQLIEAQRIQERVEHNLDSLQETGFCPGIENYSRHLELREAGSTPYTIFDYFNDDWLLVVDESHMTLPQIRGMYNGNLSRKQTLVDYGFCLPSSLDNRPLEYQEFIDKTKQAIFISATPNQYEIELSGNCVVEQIVRPTGLLDPKIEIHSQEGQIDDLVKELKEQIKKKERTMILVLTIKLAEELTSYLLEKKFKVAYLHNELTPIERDKVLTDLRIGKYDAVIGINLLREGIDLPEVSLITIFDADKPGFFRSTQSLIQIFGRAARNANGRVILYANELTEAMAQAIEETNRRRKIQEAYNKEHNIIPKTIIKPIRETISTKDKDTYKQLTSHTKNKEKITKAIAILRKKMLEAAKNQEYEQAAYLRDLILDYEKDINLK